MTWLILSNRSLFTKRVNQAMSLMPAAARCPALGQLAITAHCNK
jgi:hypothetical protein